MTASVRFLIAAFVLVLTACGPSSQSDVSETFGPRLERIAFASCSVQFKSQDHWTVMGKENLDLFIFGGDNIYGELKLTDGKVSYAQHSPELLAENYQFLANIPEFAAFRGAVRILPIWDDHDYGQSDGGQHHPFREASEKLFLDFWEVPQDDPRRSRPGIYTADIFGPVGERVQIIRLDTRYFRSELTKKSDPAKGRSRPIPDADPDKTMLGSAQWAWLEDQLKMEADVRLIVSSIQVEATTQPYEKWENLPLERARLFQLVADTKANGVVLLSGDRHKAGLYARRKDIAYPLFEMTSSSLNHTYPPSGETDPLLLGEIYYDPNYSMITFDWEKRTLVLEIKDMEGKAVRTAGLEIDNLR